MKTSNIIKHQSNHLKTVSPFKSTPKSKIKQIASYKSAEKNYKTKNSQFNCKISTPSSQLTKDEQYTVGKSKNSKAQISPFNKKKYNQMKIAQTATNCFSLFNQKKMTLLQSTNLEQKHAQKKRAQIANKLQQNKQKNQNVSIKQSLKEKIQQFKFLQKMHSQQLQNMRNKLSVEQNRRLSKIHSLETLQAHQAILLLEKTTKDGESSKNKEKNAA